MTGTVLHNIIVQEVWCQVLVLFLQSPLSSCVVSGACTSCISYTPAFITLTDSNHVHLRFWELNNEASQHHGHAGI